MKKYPNVYLDLSGSGVYRYGVYRYGVYRYGVLANGIKKVGKHKFLFGTDYPIANPHMMVQGILYEKLSDDELKAVFSENFKYLTGI